MRKEPISVTLATDNLVWLRGRARAGAGKSVSDVLDRLVGEARAGRRGMAEHSRSVLGSVSLSADDPDLESADSAIRLLFARALRRPSRRPASAQRDTERRELPIIRRIFEH